MGNVDLADKLRVTYCLGMWVHNIKWRWLMVCWGLGMMLTNTYVTYLKVNKAYRVDKTVVITSQLPKGNCNGLD